MKHAWLLLLLLSQSGIAMADASFSTRLQYQFFHTRLDDSSLPALNGNAINNDHFVDARLMLQSTSPDWVWGVHSQIQAIHSDTLQQLALSPATSLTGASVGIADDDRRLFDLTTVSTLQSDTVWQLRLDRLFIGQNLGRFSWRAGRFAVSWGHGLVYQPFDIFNPFDPLAIDREYKPGDDMLYAQYLLDSGDDFQLIAVPRRNPLTDEVSADQSSFAIKWHSYLSLTDVELLLARHFDEDIIGAGFATDISGALWQGDVTYTRSSRSDFAMLVTSLSYSWNSFNMPTSGFIEYFYSGVGLHNDTGYTLTELQNNPALLDRLTRGELFTLGRHYLAAGLDIELHPLLHLVPTILHNLDDASSLLQVLFNWSVRQDLTLIAGTNLSLGSTGTEYGSADATQPAAQTTGQSGGDSFFLRLSAYF